MSRVGAACGLVLLLGAAWTQDAGGRPAVDVLATAKALASSRFAGYVYGSSGEKKEVDCVGFVVAVVETLAKEAGVTLGAETRRQITISNLEPDEMKRLDELVVADDPRLTGVRKALVDAGLGTAVDPREAKPGDFVQYWYRQGGRWRGHAVIIESIDAKSGEATLYGSHQSTLQSEKGLPASQRHGGIGPGPVFKLTDPARKVFVVRWKSVRQ